MLSPPCGGKIPAPKDAMGWAQRGIDPAIHVNCAGRSPLQSLGWDSVRLSSSWSSVLT